MTRRIKTIPQSLADITTHWPDLIDDIAAATYGSTAPSIGSSPEGEKLPGGTDRMSLLAEGRHILATWCHLVLDERGEHYNLGSTHLDATDGTGMASWLKPHAEWIASHVLGEEAIVELDHLAHSLTGLVAPSGIRRPIVGRCPINECAGMIRAQIEHGKTEDDQARDLTCDIDASHAWDKSRWRMLGRVLGHIAPERMLPKDLAPWLSARFRKPISEATIRVWAHRYPLSIAPDAGGRYDRIAVTDWLIQRREQRTA